MGWLDDAFNTVTFGVFDDPDPPRVPPAGYVARQQEDANRRAYEANRQSNLDAFRATIAATMTDQNTPLGSLDYRQSGTDQYGNPMYTADTKVAPQFQKYVSGQGPDLGTGVDSRVNQRMQHQLGYLKPFQEWQSQNLETTLRNQGIMPGSGGNSAAQNPAYQRATTQLRDDQNQSVQSFLAQIQPEAFKQAIQEYTLPLDTAISATAGAKGSYVGTPGFQLAAAQMAPANYIGAYQNQQDALMKAYEAQMDAYSGKLQGLGSAAGQALGSNMGQNLMKAGFSALGLPVV